jgi:starch-binding outer membrane protein, SusD/RagB family
MRNRLHWVRRVARLFALASVGVSGCQLDVANPSVVDASTIDLSSSATLLTMSAQTTFWNGLSLAIVPEGWFSGEAWVTDINTSTPDFGRREMTPSTQQQSNFIWSPLSQALAANENVLIQLGALPGQESNINVARAAMNSAFTLEHMGQAMCQGVILGGPPLTQAQTLDTAIVRFKRAIAVATAASGAAGDTIAKASTVGLAQAYLQRGDNANALATAATVPASFLYSARYVDDLSNRARVSNRVFSGITGTGSPGWVLPPAYRALNDPRVPWVDLGRTAADTIRAVQSLKYTGFGSPIRIASGLEASYIVAEANLKLGNSAAALALIPTRRSAGNQPAFTGTSTATILAELMDQRARDFYMEGKHIADYVRNPSATPYVAPAGTLYYQSGGQRFGSQTCITLPLVEIQANPNFPH